MSWRIPFKTFQRERSDPREAAPFKVWPADLALERIEAISVNARTTWFGLLGLLAFVLVTLLGVEDIDFFGYGRETDLPLIGVSVPTTTFFVAAPILTTAVYAYFHFYLLKLWDALGRAPARIGGDPLGDRIHPWLLSDAALLLREEEGAAPRRAMRYLSAITSAGLTWVFGWTVLGIAWWRSLPAHYEWLSLLIVACFFIALWVGINSLVAAWRRVRLKAFDDRSHLVWRTPLRLAAVWLSVLAGFLLTWNKTEGGLEGYLEGVAVWVSDAKRRTDKRNDETSEQRTARHEAALPRWLTTRVMGSDETPRASEFDPFETGWSDYVIPADLFEAQITEKPADWLDRDTAEKAARRAWCSRRDRNWALCVKSPDDRQRASRARWCEGQDASSSTTLSDCDAFFDREEAEFQSEWLARRNDYLSVLKKPNLEGRDLRGANLANAFLPDVDMEGVRLEGANLSGAHMEDVVLRGSRMEGASFRGARMEGAELRGAKMEGADLNGARLGAIYAGCSNFEVEIDTCQPVRLDGADLREARMDGADLSHARIRRADLRMARMEGANLRGAHLDEADLRGANLNGAHLRRAQMNGSDLRGAWIEGADASAAEMRAAYLSETQMQGANLRGTDMEGADLSGAQLQSTDLSDATFGASSLVSANLSDARGLTQEQISNAIGNSGTILPVDGETGEPLFVWSCWKDEPEALGQLLVIHPEYRRRIIRSEWVCDEASGAQPQKTGVSSATGFRQGFSLKAGRGF